MSKSFAERYKSAGVDVEAGYKSVELIKEHVKRTNIPGVLSSIGGFGGLFELVDISKYKNPVLVSGTDGVGTKLKLAFLMDKHDTVGIDCVAMCVNDIVCGGAKPLIFLDYIAVGKNYPEKVSQIVKGISDGCVMAECALVGGETAEMPGFYPVDEYDLAGFSVGIVDKEKIIENSSMKKGDVLIGVSSSGVHSNGFSLVRKVFNIEQKTVNMYVDELGMTLGESLLEPTKIYVKPVLALCEKIKIKGISHITGGGFYENIPRMLKEGTTAKINEKAVDVLPIFNLISKTGNIEKREMFNTFNMGIGLVLCVDKNDADTVVSTFNAFGEKAVVIGELDDGETGVEIC